MELTPHPRLHSSKDAEEVDKQSVNIGSQQSGEEILIVSDSRNISEAAIGKESAVSTDVAANDKDEPLRTTLPAPEISLDLATTSRDDPGQDVHKSTDADVDNDADSHQAKHMQSEVQTDSGNTEDKDK